MSRPRRRVFVLLAPTRNMSDWKARYLNGEIPDWSPYGYGHAEEFGYSIEFSKTFDEALLTRAIDALTRLILGFKIVHAIRNWPACRDPSVIAIWTHTEREHLPLLFLSWCLRRPIAPLVAQSVWLTDEWGRMSALHRRIARALMRRASLCTFLSPTNAREANRLGLGRRCEVIAFGVSLDSFPLTEPTCRRREDDPIRIFALGNDRHRDWRTFAEAFCHDPRFDIFAATSTFPLPSTGPNWCARQTNHAEIVERYRWADVVVVPLKANRHASGITAVLEAVFLGKPVVASDTGGIDWYFDRDQLALCPVGDAEALRSAVEVIAENPAEAERRARAAQAAVTRKNLTSKGYAARHVALTEELLATLQSAR